MNDRLKDIVHDVGEENFGRVHLYNILKSDSDEQFYPRCANFTCLSTTLTSFNLKARNGWTDKSFTKLLELLKEMLPENIISPNCNKEAKKIICPMQEYTCIPNDCVLYIDKFVALMVCPMCRLS